MKKLISVCAISLSVLASNAAMADETKVAKMDESAIVMSTQSSAGDWVIPLLLLVLVAAALSDSNGMAYPPT